MQHDSEASGKQYAFSQRERVAAYSQTDEGGSPQRMEQRNSRRAANDTHQPDTQDDSS